MPYSLETAPPRLSMLASAGAILVMFFWAICFPLINIGLTFAPPMSFATLRGLLSGGALLLIAEALRLPGIENTRDWVSITFVGLTATSLGFFGMFYGGGLVSPGLATVIANTQPLIAAVLAWWLLDEHLRPIQRLGLAVGFAGIILIGIPGMSGTTSQSLGLIFILVAAVGIAVSNVLLKRLAGRVDPLRAMGWQLLIGSVPLAVFASTQENISTISWSLPFVITLVVLSLIGTSAAFVLWFSLLRLASLSKLNVFTFLTPIFGLAIGYVFFAEQIHPIALAGIGLSLLGIYWVSRLPTSSS